MKTKRMLTRRETELVAKMQSGTTKTIDLAEALRISPHTVNNHLRSIFVKTNTNSKTQILAMLISKVVLIPD